MNNLTKLKISNRTASVYVSKTFNQAASYYTKVSGQFVFLCTLKNKDAKTSKVSAKLLSMAKRQQLTA